MVKGWESTSVMLSLCRGGKIDTAWYADMWRRTRLSFFISYLLAQPLGSDSRSARYGYTSLRLQTWTLLTDASEAELEMQINVLLLMLKKKKNLQKMFVYFWIAKTVKHWKIYFQSFAQRWFWMGRRTEPSSFFHVNLAFHRDWRLGKRESTCCL